MCVCHCVRNILQCNVGERVCAYVQHTIEECSKFEYTFYRMRVSLYMDDYYTEIPHKKQTALLKTHQNDCKKPCHVFSGAFTALTSAFIHWLDYFSIFGIFLFPQMNIWLTKVPFRFTNRECGFVPRLLIESLVSLTRWEVLNPDRWRQEVKTGSDQEPTIGGWSRVGTILSLFNR